MRGATKMPDIVWGGLDLTTKEAVSVDHRFACWCPGSISNMSVTYVIRLCQDHELSRTKVRICLLRSVWTQICDLLSL
jgi:hypothetical protein